MIVVAALIWDDWNKGHIARHNVSIQEVEEICFGKHNTTDSYRKRVLILGKTKAGKGLAVVLSSEDREEQPYGSNSYYVITAFEKEMK